MIALVMLFNVGQWLFAPYLIRSLYGIRRVRREDAPEFYGTVEKLSARSGIKMPRIGLSRIQIPNAFAFGSPIAGNHLAITQGLIDTLEKEEVEAVLGHELGHIKHRDVQIMMMSSLLPSLFYLIGRWMMFSSYYGGYNREKRGSGGAVLIGSASMLMYFVLSLLTLHLSRLREYFADAHSASVVEEGSRKLSEGLAKITSKTSRIRKLGNRETFSLNGFKSLFISDPDTSEYDSAQISQLDYGVSDQMLVEQLIDRRISVGEKLIEVFSSHPNITKRLLALKELQRQS